MVALIDRLPPDIAHQATGFICLQPGDAVFARPAGGRADGTDDVLQVVVLAE